MEQFDKHIQEKLSNMEMSPPSGFWHNISDQLDAIETPEATVRTSSHTFYRILRVAAVFVGFFSLGFLFYSSNTSVDDSEVASVIKNKFPSVDISSPVMFENNIQKTIDEKVPTPLTSIKKAPKASNSIASTTSSNILIEPTTNLVQVLPSSDDIATADFSFEQSNIPVYSLKLLNKDIPANDEIIVINNKKQNNSKMSDKVSVSKKALPWRF
jgi:hypothetical protein